MKKALILLLVAVCLLQTTVQNIFSQTLQTKLQIVQDGRPLAKIVIAAKANDNAKTASAELQKYVEKISGAKLPIVTDESSHNGILILVGPSKLTEQVANLQIPSGRTKDLREEGFAIKTTVDRIVLAGNDESPYLGTRYSVSQFLHNLGVRWFMPGEVGEIVPAMTNITVEPVDITQRPDFPVRDWWEHARNNMAELQTEWKIRNLMNPYSVRVFGNPSDGSIGKYLPKDQFDAHPYRILHSNMIIESR